MFYVLYRLGRPVTKTGVRQRFTSDSMGFDVSDLFHMLLYDAGLSERNIQKLVRIDVRNIHAMDLGIFLHNGLDDHSHR